MTSVSIEQQSNRQAKKKQYSKPLMVMAEIISYVFHPVFFPILMALMLYLLDPISFRGIPEKQINLWFITIIFSAVFIPLFAIALMKPLGFIGSFKMETARERTIPIMATMIFYFWVSHVFNSMQIPGIQVPLILKVLLLGNFWGIILVFLVNIFTKISMHTSVAGAMVGIILVLMFMSRINMAVPLFIAIGLAGLIGTARLVLGAHQRGDIWVGYLIGITVQLCAYWYMK